MEPITDAEAAMIEMARRLARSLISRLTAKGVQPADVTIGIAYALHDAATDLAGDPFAAVEWMRTAADLMEQSLMEKCSGKPAPN